MINLNLLHKQNTLFDNRYSLKTKLGGGGFSEVWLAFDTKSQNDVALKVYAQTNDLDEDGIAMFRNEFSIVCNFNHTNILRPFSFEISEEHPYLVLPYCPKGSASKLIKNISEDELWQFINDVASGLSYLHSLDGTPVVHQDIKPANVLIDARGQYLITDFGISTGLHRTLSKKVATSENEGSGTLAYMAPERFGSHTMPLMANDIWSLGATLYELVTGELPFGEFGGLTQSKMKNPPPIEGPYSKELKGLIYKCLSEETWNRPSAGELVEAVKCRKLKPTKPATDNTWKKYRPIALIMALVFVFMAGLFFYQNHKIEVEKIERLAKNDSIALGHMQKADDLVLSEWENAGNGNKIENVQMTVFIEASDLYQSALALECNDEIMNTIKAHKNESEVIIDSIYSYFTWQENYYRDLDANDAADEFANKRMAIEKIKNMYN